MNRKCLFQSKSGVLSLIGLLPLLCFLFQTHAFADMASTNYSIAGQFVGGSGSESSTNYQVAESALNVFSQPALSSSNYQLGSGAETFSATDLARISAVSPENHPVFYSDSTADYTVTAVDPDNDTLQYRARQDGTLKAGPQSSNQLSWNLSNDDPGRRNIELAVIDPDGTVVTNQSAYVVRRPVK
ncbi:MAG: hypothetical protein WC530_04780 [Candidatus Omnitrophota bacterium]|jgi:hypothetical protein